MTPLAILEATYDGAIPAEAYRAALDRRESPIAKRPRVRPALPRDTRPLPERMAERMVECHRLYGRCLERDLHRAGFSPAELAAYGAEAVAIAASRAPDLEVPA